MHNKTLNSCGMDVQCFTACFIANLELYCVHISFRQIKNVPEYVHFIVKKRVTIFLVKISIVFTSICSRFNKKASNRVGNQMTNRPAL